MFIPALQVFSIGFILGLSGPCLLYCLPVILALSAGSKERFSKNLAGIAVFLSGRLLAYVLLGALAGASGMILSQFIGSGLSLYFKAAAGLVSIAFGLYVLFYRQEQEAACSSRAHRVMTGGGFFIFGLAVGISPCPPLMGLLLEITLISKSILQGALYGAMFGLGTFISGFILAGGLSGVLRRIPARILKPVSALVLVLFGIFFILSAKR